MLVSSVFLAVGAPHLALYQSQELYHTPARAGRTLMWDKRIIDIDDKMYGAGCIFGVFSAGFYVFARIPQIIKNVSPSLSLSLSLSLLVSVSSPSLSSNYLIHIHIHSSCAVQWRACLCTCSFCPSLAISLMVWAFSSTQWMASFFFKSYPGWWAVWAHWCLISLYPKNRKYVCTI